MNPFNNQVISHELRELNSARIKRFLRLPTEIRKQSTLPYLISPRLSDLGSKFPIGIYAMQPQEWGSSIYDQPSSSQDMLDFLDKEYLLNLYGEANMRFKPIKIYWELKKEFQDIPAMGFILNNLIKIGMRGTYANNFIGEANELEEFKILDLKEYAVINSQLTIVLAGHEDYYGRASYLFMDDRNLTLSKEEPVRIYRDFRGKPVIHTYHPSYWHNLGTVNDVVGEERILGIIKGIIRKTYSEWKNSKN